MNTRWLTHESDDARWEMYSKLNNLPFENILLPPNIFDQSESNEDNHANINSFESNETSNEDNHANINNFESNETSEKSQENFHLDFF